ncbi:MAG: hypothetical protein DMF77_07020 [Acidobacteria bacterium]|nr:MAG: hypothetical protein DMF77_07020 [Acidobacteriota bacterium]
MLPVPQGVTGELFLGGVQVGRGYHNRPELTAEKFVPNPFSSEPGQRLYRTGDLVRHLRDGQIEFLGRVDHQVKVRGFRIELGEIESVLSQHPAVRDAVLHARTDEVGDTRLVAYVVPVAGTAVSAGELRQHAQERLPPYMVPASFVVLEEMPLGPSGKVDRRALPSPEDVGVERETPFVAPRTPIEEGVAEIWSQILHVDRIGVHDSFFERGGHSLLVTQLVSRLLKTFDVELPLRAVFQTPTVAELAAKIEASRRGTSMPPLAPLSRESERTQSFAQQRLWFLEQLQPGSSAYNVSTGVFLGGELSTEALRLSLQAIVDRHESLRTTFVTKDGRPLQVVAPAMVVPLAEVDLRGLPDPEAQARRLAEEEASRPFDLARGPLLRATLLRLAEQEHALLLTVHHIVFDAWSMGIFAREQALLYAAHVSGEPSPLRPLDVQYADFAAWQRDWLQGEVLERQLGYWREQLEGLQALELPMDHARPAVQTFDGAWRQRTLPLLEQVRQLGRQEGTTLFMTLLAAFQALLHRYTGMDDVAVGSPIANRPRVELEALVGLFVNSLVLRTDLSGDPTFRDLLARVKDVALGAYDHQDVPFERLVEEVGGQRDLGRNPLFQVMFTLHGTAVEPVALPGLQARPLETATTPTHVDLELHLHENAGTLAATAVYNRDLFEASTIDRMLGHFQVLLEAIVARPDARLSELALLTPLERRHTLVDWNETSREYAREAAIHELFEAQAARTPDAIAVSFDGQELSYGELNARGNRLARHLRRHGAGLEVRVGICMDRSVEMVVGLLGILKAGAAYVPLDPSYPKERLAFMIEDSRVPVLLAQERMLEALPEYAGRVTCLDRDSETIAAESDASVASGAGGQSLAYVIYTSGSTGIPKGAAISHRAVNRLVVNTDYVQVQPSDRVAQASNASFDAATFEIWGALLSGARLVGISRQVTLSPRDLAAELRRSEVTILFLTTALFNQVVREDAGAFSSLRHLLFGGEAVDPTCVRDLLKAGPPERLLHVYGPTETTTYATWHLVAQVPEDATTVPIGRPAGAHGGEVRPRPVFGRGRGAALPHGRPREVSGGRRHRVPGPGGPPGEAARIPHRARGDRVGPRAAARGEGRRGDREGRPSGRQATRGVRDRAPRPRYRRGSAAWRPPGEPARPHGARGVRHARAAAFEPERQGGSAGATGARRAIASGRGTRAATRRPGAGDHRHLARGPRSRCDRREREFLRSRRALARPAPGPREAAEGRDGEGREGRGPLRIPHGQHARRLPFANRARGPRASETGPPGCADGPLSRSSRPGSVLAEPPGWRGVDLVLLRE